eukprot:3445411-Rhodomonas_salina.1
MSLQHVRYLRGLYPDSMSGTRGGSCPTICPIQLCGTLAGELATAVCGQITDVKFAPGGRLLAVAGTDSFIDIFDVKQLAALGESE